MRQDHSCNSGGRRRLTTGEASPGRNRERRRRLKARSTETSGGGGSKQGRASNGEGVYSLLIRGCNHFRVVPILFLVSRRCT